MECIVCDTTIDDYEFAFWTDGDSAIVSGGALQMDQFIGFEDGPYCGLVCVEEVWPPER